MNPPKSGRASDTTWTNWNSIQWDKVTRAAKSLQARIVKAVKTKHFHKAKALLHLLTRSFYGKLLAILRVTSNKGCKTCGVDKVVWDTPAKKRKAIEQLSIKRYKAQPLKRKSISKKNGKFRHLGIPSFRDRAFQALFKLGLEPIAETTADPNSYGFRPKRSCADAIVQCHNVLSQRNSAVWVFEADIKGCFDNISHQWILQHIPLSKKVLAQWLKAGYMEKKHWYPTHRGTPQGGIISPVIANMVLDGLEKAINLHARHKPKSNPFKINFVRYADDFVVTGNDSEYLEREIKPLICRFLAIRGLELSEEKTKITHINEGFNFLSQNVRKYKGKLLIHPSKEAVQSFKDKLRKLFRENRGIPAHALIRRLNPVIRGWSNYHKGICSKRTFTKLGVFIYRQLKRWAKYQHGNKNRWWIYHRYFHDNHFTDHRTTPKGTEHNRLYRIAYVPVRYHVKVKAGANPFLEEYDNYFYQRTRWREELAKECKQITTFISNKDSKNSRVSLRRDSL